MMHDEFQQIADKEHATAETFTHTVRVCTAAGCLSSQSDQLKKNLETLTNENGHKGHCKVKGVGCMGLCSAGPLVSVETKGKDPVLYREVKPEDAGDIVASLEGAPVERLHCPTNVPFFQRQQKIVLENSGTIDPERIEEYIAADGYSGLFTALTEMTPADVIDEVIRSGLRGRGGGGYPTGLKWTTVAKADGTGQKYVICNADEGDPGAFMDRSVLEGDPHRVLEG
ncbi:MAG TPA: NAD(P)H-dependent oxidoreductase subunit E, partial [Anaerolineales bacterium]|nr:NAD(P)H-dependent oxidoreductase subunit E [Anaerolineales bacterium]